MAIDKIKLAKDFRASVLAFISSATNLSDFQALQMTSMFPIWPNGTNEEGNYIQNQIVQYENKIYRIMQPTVKPIDSQKPGDEGLLAVYRPIVLENEGTLEDPIPWIYGMDCYSGKYYTYNNEIYKCNGDMIPCVWIPGSEGVYQWEKVTEPEVTEEPTLADGTLENPIPFVLNMDCEEGKYYSYNSKVYLCKLTMPTCSWAPGTAGLWQWELVE